MNMDVNPLVTMHLLHVGLLSALQAQDAQYILQTPTSFADAQQAHEISMHVTFLMAECNSVYL